MKYLTQIGLLMAILTVFAACSQPGATSSDHALKSIPADVTGVTEFDLPALMKKADFEAVRKMEFYQEMVKEAREENQTFGDVVADPAKSGIDLEKNAYLTTYVNPENPEELFTGFVVTLSDAAAFEKLVQANGEAKITKADGYQVASGGSTAVAWSDQTAIIGGLNTPYAKVEDFVGKFFGVEEANSVAGNADLQKCLSGNHDINSWLTSNALAKNQDAQMALTMGGFSAEALNDNFIHSYVDFNDGEINSHSDLMLQDALTKDLNLIFKDKVGKDLTNNLPGDNQGMVMTAAFDFEGIQQMLTQRPQAVGMTNFALQQYGLTLADIANTFGGDIALSMNEVDGEPVLTFVTNIISNEKLDKFLQLGVDFNMIEKIDDTHYRILNAPPLNPTKVSNSEDPILLIKDDIISISGNGAFTEKIASGGFGKNAKAREMAGNIFGFYLDYSAINELMENNDKVEKIKEMTLTTKRKDSDFNMKFSDGSTNSLKQVFEAINAAYLKDQKGSDM